MERKEIKMRAEINEIFLKSTKPKVFSKRLRKYWWAWWIKSKLFNSKNEKRDISIGLPYIKVINIMNLGEMAKFLEKITTYLNGIRSWKFK